MSIAQLSNPTVESYADELQPGTQLLQGQFQIDEFLNSGGFGITYLARDSLNRKVVIKECFPSSLCRRSQASVQPKSQTHTDALTSIVDLFVLEARRLAKLDHPNIVGVHQVFKGNETAYMALDFVTGRDLLDTLEDTDHGLTPPQIKGILKDVLGAIGYIHDQGILHRDISPDNILIDENMRPVLIDFGAAREKATKKSRVLSAMHVVKDGYSPQEFYIQGSEQTPSSDLYALAATFYHLIVGETPPNSQSRLTAVASGEKDNYEPLAGRIKGYDRKFLNAIDQALNIFPKDRLQSAQEWLGMLEGQQNISRVLSRPIPMSSAAAETAAANKKGKMLYLLGSVAVIAAIAGTVFVVNKALQSSGSAGGDIALSAPETSQFPILDKTQADVAVNSTAQGQAEPEIPPGIAQAVAGGRITVLESSLVVSDQVSVQATVAPAVSIPTPEVEPALADGALDTVVISDGLLNAASGDSPEIVQVLAGSTAGSLPLEVLAKFPRPVGADAAATSEGPNIALLENLPAFTQENLVVPTSIQIPGGGALPVEINLAALDAAPDVTFINSIPRFEDSAPLPDELAPELPANFDVAISTPTPAEPGILAVTTVPTIIQTPLAAELPAQLATVTTLATAVSDVAIAPEIVVQDEISELNDGVELRDTGTIDTGTIDTGAIDTGTIQETSIEVASLSADVFEMPKASDETLSFVSQWQTELPFSFDGETNVITRAGIVSPVWANQGARIIAVNDISITRLSDLYDALRATVNPGDNPLLSVTFTVQPADGGSPSDQPWKLSVFQETKVFDSVSFVTRFDGASWKTKVSEVQDDAVAFKVGDQLEAYLGTSEALNKRTSLQSVLDSQPTANNRKYSFAISRDGAMRIVTLEIDGES